MEIVQQNGCVYINIFYVSGSFISWSGHSSPGQVLCHWCKFICVLCLEKSGAEKSVCITSEVL